MTKSKIKDTEPKCRSCGKPYIDHLGLIGTCNELQLTKNILKETLKDLENIRFHVAQTMDMIGGILKKEK